MKQRIARVNELIRREMSGMFERDFRDSRYGMVTVTEVRVSNDLQFAKIFYSVYGGRTNEDAVERRLQVRGSLLQRELGDRIRMRYTPQLRFILDESPQQIEKIDKIIGELKKENMSS